MAEVTDEQLLDEITEAVFAAYDAAPSGEGESGALAFAGRAAYFVAKGMDAPAALEAAIPVGHYGKPRLYKLVPV